MSSVENNKAQTRIAIVGGGIAGLLTALALHKIGLEPEIYEAYETTDSLTVGSWLTVAVNGMSALKILGLDAAIRHVGFESRHIDFYNGGGKHLARIPIGGQLPDGTVTHTLKRTDLYGVFLAAVQEAAIPIHSNHRLERAFLSDNGKVALTFTNSTVISDLDLVVGADGVRSAVRTFIAQHYGSTAPQPRYTGLGNCGGFVPRSTLSAEDLVGHADFQPDVYRMIFGYRAFFGYTVHPTGDVWWFANPPLGDTQPTREALQTTDWRAQLLDLFADDSSPANTLINKTPDAIHASMQFDLPHVAAWHVDHRIILVGDAAHAAAPSSGQGVSQAAEDAVELARCLRDLGLSQSALETFISLRRSRVQRVVEHGARGSAQKAPGFFGRFLRDLLLPWILWLFARQAPEWLFNHRIDWEQTVSPFEP